MKSKQFFYIWLLAGMAAFLPTYSFAQTITPVLKAIINNGKITLRVSNQKSVDSLFFQNANGQVALDFYFKDNDPRNGLHNAQPSLQAQGDVYLSFSELSAQASDTLNFRATQYGPDGNIVRSYTFVNGDYMAPDNNAPTVCPTSILCDNSGLWIVFDPHTYNVTHAREMSFSLSFGDDNPYNGIYNWDKWTGLNLANNSIRVDGNFDCSQISTGIVTIVFDGLVCQFDGGQLVGDNNCSPFGDYYMPGDLCAEYFESCGSTILSILLDKSTDLACRQWKENDVNNCNTSTYIYRPGSVSIGTSGRAPETAAGNATKAALTVKNGVITNKVKIKLCDAAWCDYVFEPGYALRSLPETEAYIQQNCHLPGMPAGDALESEGAFELGDVTRLQQEKIEEIFLHLIRLESEVDCAESLLGWLEWRDKWQTR